MSMTHHFSLRREPFEFYPEFDSAGEFPLSEFAEDWQGEVPAGTPVKDDFIYWVQESLNALQGSSLKLDGDIGGSDSNTRKAVRAFQRSKGLPLLSNSGPICPDTERALIAAGKTFPLKEARGAEPLALTLYVNIPLQIPLAGAKSMTGIFIPENYCPLPQIDLIVFLHGFKLRTHDPSYSIDTYWSLPLFRLREEVNQSGKNVILVAPTLGPSNQPGSLTCPGGFDRFLERVIEALKLRGPYASSKTSPSIRNIILACHSGSGEVMRAIAMGSDASVAKIQECWAFETSSMGSAATWKTWPKPPLKTKLFIHPRSGNPGQALCENLTKTRMPASGQVTCTPNIFAEKTTIEHDAVPMTLFKDRIQKASFLVDKSSCAGKQSRRMKPPTRSRSRLSGELSQPGYGSAFGRYPSAHEWPGEMEFETAQPTRGSESNFEWENREDAFEEPEEEAYETIRLSQGSHEFETSLATVPKPKTISLFNTDLNAPYFGGNFNFLYNGGSNEAWITYNTYFSYTRSFSQTEKDLLLDNLKKAVAIWDDCAEIQVKDVAGNYNDRIRLRFKLNIVTNSRNANKRTQVHPNGSRSVFFIDKDRETVMRDLNIFIGSSRNVLVHELGHVWGLKDEYKDRWISMKLSLGHVGPDSPLIKDTRSIMNVAYDDKGEFRTRFFQHFGRTILGAFWGLKNYMIPARFNGKVVSNSVMGRIALRKRNISGDPPYTADQPPFNTVFTNIQIAKRA